MKTQRSPIPSLPAELWMAIFDLATFVPHSFDHDAIDPFMSPWALGIEEESFPLNLRGDIRAVRQSLRTKSIISRVCRAWHVYVAHLLYEVISVIRNRDICALSERFMNSKVSSSGGAAVQSCGSYTRRFDIALPREHFLSDPIVTRSLVQLIRQLSRLEISIIYFGPHSIFSCTIPNSIAEAFRIACTGTLRKLVWQGYNIIREGEEAALTLIENAAGLRTLACIPCNTVHTVCALQKVDKLSFYSPLFCPKVPIPVAQHPSFHNANNLYLRSWVSAQMQDGMPVTAYVVCPFGAPWWYEQRIPSLRQVVFFYRSPVTFATDIVNWVGYIPEGVTRIGFQFGFAQAKDYVYEALRTFLSDLTEQRRTVEVVRIMNPSLLRDLARKHTKELRLLVREMEGRSFRLEDHLGRQIQLP